MVLRRPPLGFEQAVAVETMERLVERRVLDLELAVRPFLDGGGDPVTVPGPARQGAEDEKVECAGNERQLRWRGRLLSP
jgi:hypothetical protein